MLTLTLTLTDTVVDTVLCAALKELEDRDEPVSKTKSERERGLGMKKKKSSSASSSFDATELGSGSAQISASGTSESDSSRDNRNTLKWVNIGMGQTALMPTMSKPSEAVSSINKHNTLFVFGAYYIGKERLYMALSAELNIPVHVDKARYRALNCYSDWSAAELGRLSFQPCRPAIVKSKLLSEKTLSQSNESEPHHTNICSAGILVVGMADVNFNKLKTVLSNVNANCDPHCQFTRIVAFQPTGWTFKQALKKF